MAFILFPMEQTNFSTKVRAVLLAALVVLAVGCAPTQQVRNLSGSNPHLTLTPAGDASEGSWEARGHIAPKGMPFWMMVTVEEPNASGRTVGLHSDRIEFTADAGLPGGPASIHFLIAGEGGQVSFSGAQSNQESSGTFRTKFNPAFVQAVESLLDPPPSGVEWLLLVLRDVGPDYIRRIQETGQEVSAADVIRLSLQSISPEFIAELRNAGYRFSTEDLIRLRRGGVASGYAANLATTGDALSADEIISLRRAGVSDEYFLGMKRFRPDLEVDGVVRLRRAGISPDLLGAFDDFGFSEEDLIGLRRSGITPDYATAIRDAGYDFSPDEIIQIRRAGVSPQYLTAAKQAGYDFTAEELVKLRRAGVSADYLAALHLPGRKNLPVDLIVESRRRGLPPETVQQIRAHP
jgi:hypothetical protein